MHIISVLFFSEYKIQSVTVMYMMIWHTGSLGTWWTKPHHSRRSVFSGPFWSFEGIPIFLCTTVVTTSKCGWKSHSVTQSHCDTINMHKVFQPSHLLLHHAGAGLFRVFRVAACVWRLCLFIFTLTQAAFLSLLAFKINRWALYLHVDISFWSYDDMWYDMGKRSWETICRPGLRATRSTSLLCLIVKAFTRRIRPQVIIPRPCAISMLLISTVTV